MERTERKRDVPHSLSPVGVPFLRALLYPECSSRFQIAFDSRPQDKVGKQNSLLIWWTFFVLLPQSACFLFFFFPVLDNCSMLSVQGFLVAFSEKGRVEYIYSIFIKPGIPHKFLKMLTDRN